MNDKSINFTFKQNILKKYGEKFLRIYKFILKENAPFEYICEMKYKHNVPQPAIQVIQQFLWDNGIEYIGLYGTNWFALKNKKDLQKIKLLFSVMLNIGIGSILRVSLLNRYRFACKRFQDRMYRAYRNAYRDKNKDNYIRREMNGMNSTRMKRKI